MTTGRLLVTSSGKRRRHDRGRTRRCPDGPNGGGPSRDGYRYRIGVCGADTFSEGVLGPALRRVDPNELEPPGAGDLVGARQGRREEPLAGALGRCLRLGLGAAAG
jgi:hypothetical protein